ncbi:MAG: hypothetical protein Q9178_008016, partial [Gyalolechia marmorata]
MLLWDGDIETEVSGATLNYLAEYYNTTHYGYVSDEELPVKRTCHFNINPAIEDREHDIIDAQWINTSKGLCINITGLSERDM